MIKRVLCLIILFIFLCSASPASNNNAYKVLRVIDGDTVYLDFNNNNQCDKNERVRLNGIDTFEVKDSSHLKQQMKYYNLTKEEALGLGYLAKEFGKKRLLGKKVRAVYSAQKNFDDNGRHLMSIYYDCDISTNQQSSTNKKYNNTCCKNYEKEILKAGLAVIYRKSNIAKSLENFENHQKLRLNKYKTHNLNLVTLDKKTNLIHKPDCINLKETYNIELLEIKQTKYKTAECCLSKAKK